MKKVTKTLVSNFLADTKGDAQWTVISFDKKTGIRYEAYIDYEFFSAFVYMTNKLATGKYDVITRLFPRTNRNQYYNAGKTMPRMLATYSLTTSVIRGSYLKMTATEYTSL